ncbi:MAG TPA: hypothetical protein DCY27_11755, partial [Desulfobacterales bacterium]|nr:hypothetical protein [Desulfobacterales bacterium]
LAAAAGSAIAALYSESTGRFLVSVAPGDQARFEALMQGSPLLQLGRVRSDDHFLVTWNGQPLIQADVRELKADWRQRFAELI